MLVLQGHTMIPDHGLFYCVEVLLIAMALLIRKRTYVARPLTLSEVWDFMDCFVMITFNAG